MTTQSGNATHFSQLCFQQLFYYPGLVKTIQSTHNFQEHRKLDEISRMKEQTSYKIKAPRPC